MRQKAFSQKKKLNEKIRIGHAPTNRIYKGSDDIIKICKKLEKEKIVEFDLIEGETSEVAIKGSNAVICL